MLHARPRCLENISAAVTLVPVQGPPPHTPSTLLITAFIYKHCQGPDALKLCYDGIIDRTLQLTGADLVRMYRSLHMSVTQHRLTVCFL